MAARELQKAIRMESADDQGFCTCVTCGVRRHYKDMHAGHFVPSRCNAILFDERGIHPQCVRCNNYLGGNQSAYTQYMQSKYDQATIDGLIAARSQTRTFTRDELCEMRSQYRQRIRQQEIRLGLRHQDKPSPSISDKGIQIQAAGRRYRLRFAALRNKLGDCDPPNARNKQIRIGRSLRGPERLDTIIHEMLHACDWSKCEESVSETATDIAVVLWKLGYRDQNELTQQADSSDATDC